MLRAVSLCAINRIKRPRVTISQRASNVMYENWCIDYESEEPLGARSSFGDLRCLALCLTPA